MLPCYVITLRERPDRLKNFLQWSSKYTYLGHSLKNIVPWIVDRDPEGGIHGCWSSHLGIYKDALKKSYKQVLIFEDDAIPNKHLTKFEQAKIWEAVFGLVYSTTSSCNFDVIGLGGCSFAYATGLDRTKHPRLLGTRFGESHAEIVSEEFMKYMLRVPYEGHIDYQIARHATKSFLVCPELFLQDDSQGTDVNPSVNYLLKYRQLGKNIHNTIAKYWPLRCPVRYLLIFVILLASLSIIHSNRTNWVLVGLVVLLQAIDITSMTFVDPERHRHINKTA